MIKDKDMETLKGIEHVYTMQEITEIVDKFFPIDDSCNLDENGFFVGWKNGEERAYKDYITGLFLKINNINWWLKGDLEPYYYRTLKDVLEKKEERQRIYDELCKELGIAPVKVEKSSYPHYSKDSKDDEVKARRRFERLVKGGYFPPETPLDDWLYIYGVSGKEPNKKPLNWLKTQEELAYMVYRIWLISDRKIWAICEAVFTINGKKPNTRTMKSYMSSLNKNWKEKDEKLYKLDEVLKV